MVGEGENNSPDVEVLDVSLEHRSGSYAEGLNLDPLQFFSVGSAGSREP